MGGGGAMLSEIGDGRLVKMEEDFTDAVDKAVPEAEASAKAGKLKDALEKLVVLEKQTRLAADMRSNSRVLLTMVQMCYKCKDWNVLNEQIIALTKKRSLIKQAVTKMVQECCTYVDKTPNLEAKLKLIDTLRTVTDGKIYVEVERARLTYKLSQMKEAEGKLEEAWKALLDLQIETYGSMERREKVELLLEQMRLCLVRSEFLRAQIISRKIASSFFQDTAIEVQKLKLKFYQQMIELDAEDSNYVAICRHWLAIYKTPMVADDPLKLQEALKNAVANVLLAPHDNEQWDQLNRIKEDRKLESIPPYKDLLNLFTIQELIDWRRDVIGVHEKTLRQGSAGSPPTGLFKPGCPKSDKRWEDLHTRVVEHNIRMIAKYYTQIKVKRMAELLDWPVEKTEEFLCALVVKGTIEGAKIDRPSGIVRFQAARQTPLEVVESWSGKVKALTEVLNKVAHLILKEEMLHRHLKPASGHAS